MKIKTFLFVFYFFVSSGSGFNIMSTRAMMILKICILLSWNFVIKIVCFERQVVDVTYSMIHIFYLFFHWQFVFLLKINLYFIKLKINNWHNNFLFLIFYWFDNSSQQSSSSSCLDSKFHASHISVHFQIFHRLTVWPDCHWSVSLGSDWGVACSNSLTN